MKFIIDPVDIKTQVKNEKLYFYVEDNYIYCTDNSCTVVVGKVNIENNNQKIEDNPLKFINTISLPTKMEYEEFNYHLKKIKNRSNR